MTSLLYEDIKLFCGNSNVKLAEGIAEKLGLKLGDMEVSTFSNGEISISLNESVRGADVFIIQSTSTPTNNHLMELLVAIDALKRASARRITAVIPYFGYSRQDRKAKPRDPISAKLVADILTTAGAQRVLTMDLHALQIQGFFNIPVDHLIGAPTLTAFVEKQIEGFDPKEFTVLAPDLGSITRARHFSKRLGCPLAVVDKRRAKANVCEVMNIIGEVENKNVILIDDMIDTAGTICNATESILKKGAKKVYACCTHPVLSGDAIRKLEESAIKKLFFLNTISINPEKMIEKFTVLDVSCVFAEAIYCIHTNIPVSSIAD